MLKSEKHCYSTAGHIALGGASHPGRARASKGFLFWGKEACQSIAHQNKSSLLASVHRMILSRLGEQRYGQRKTGLGCQRLNPSSQSAQEGTLTSFLLIAKAFAVQLCLSDVAWLLSEKGKVSQMNRMTLFCSDICNMHDTLNPRTKSHALLTRKHSPAASAWMAFILRNPCPLVFRGA